MEINELKSILKNNGVVGAGGAGFPTYAKINDKTETIIINCAECEPLLRADRQIMEKFAQEILEASGFIAEVVGASEVIIAIKNKFIKAIESTEYCLHPNSNIRIKKLNEIYPAGDEVVLTYECTGKVVPAGQIPLSVGVTVFNAETMLNAYNAIKRKIPVFEKYITIAGNVSVPQTLKAPIGISIKHLLTHVGGMLGDNNSIIMGGPMMGRLANENDNITKTTKAILVLPNDDINIIKRNTVNRINANRAMSACSSCQMCSDMCPRQLLGYPVNPHLFMRSLANGQSPDAYFCVECGLCEMYSCHQGLSPRKLISEHKKEMKLKGIQPKSINMGDISELRQYRAVPSERLVSRLGLSDYENINPLSDNYIAASVVKINLSQNIGKSAKPIVEKGFNVSLGQKIAACDENDLGVDIHSSLDGVVTNIDDTAITIVSHKGVGVIYG